MLFNAQYFVLYVTVTPLSFNVDLILCSFSLSYELLSHIFF